jgi:hemolysin III
MANWLTHGIGAVLSVVALTLLIIFAGTRGDAWHVVSFTVFGLSLFVLYTASTLYHLSRNESRRRLLRRIDQAAIFVLIAGTYTPFLLTNLRGPWGWTLFGIIWTLCGAGAAIKFFGTGRERSASIVAYLFAGWLIVAAAKPLLATVPQPGLWLLLAGGLCYSIGILFYVWRQLRFHHAFWHSFVLGGSTCHFLAVLLFLTPHHT